MRLELRIVSLLARHLEERLTINGIAKSLDEHYSFVHRTVNKLIEDGVIVEEKAGNSRLCSLDPSNEKTRALLQLGEIERKKEFYHKNRTLELALEDFTKSAESQTELVCAVLFGSRAKDTATKESDIDLLLLTTRKKGSGKTETNAIDTITKETWAKYGKEINEIMLTPEGFRTQRKSAAIREIMGNHVVLYGAEQFVKLVLEAE